MLTPLLTECTKLMHQTTDTPATHSVRHTLVVGLGATGWSVVQHLMAQGQPVAVADSREQPPLLAQLRDQYADVAVFTGPFVDQVFAQADRLVVSPGVPLSTPQIQAALARGVPVVSDIELFARAVHTPVVAITGSNGKSTVTTLVGEMARACGICVAVGGNLGTPALDLLAQSAQLYVLELSSFQLASTHSLRAQVATVLNLSADHLDWHGDMASYAAAKAVALRGAQTVVLNADDPQVMAMPTSGQRQLFSLGPPATADDFGLRRVDGVDWLCRGPEHLLRADDLRIAGRHNQANALASLAIGSALGLPSNTMCDVLRSFPGLPHRTEFVAEIDGIRWYNDSKATNVGATIAALDGLYQADGGRAVVLLGGQSKSADFAPLTPILARCARAVVLFGQDQTQIAPCVPCARVAVTDLAAAVTQAARLAQPGDHVLLSPACASFDQFSGFATRGEHFRHLVQQQLP